VPLTIDFPASNDPDTSKVSPFRNDGKRQLITYEDIATFEASEGAVTIGYVDLRTRTSKIFYHTFSTSVPRQELADVFRVINARAEKRAEDGNDFTAPWELYTE
jgi:hypothetical protein